MRGLRPALIFGSLLLTLCLGWLEPHASAETLTFQKAVELAMARSTNVNIAVADQMRAHSSYLEARNAYIPGVTVGSGLGASWGFPLSLEGAAPSIFNVNAQSTLLNFSQREFVRAAKTEWGATNQNIEDRRNQALLDASVTYLQLSAAQAKLKVVEQQAQESQRAEYTTQQRVAEGLDAKLELTRASLNTARSRVRLADAQGTVDILTQHLAQLTGLPQSSIEVQSDSLPAIPDVANGDDAVARAVANSAAVKMAEEHAHSKAQQAKGEHKALYPAVDFAAQYARLAKFNNYDVFYKTYQANNATIGVAIRFPFLSPTQRAHAEAADAEALRAKSEAEAAKNQVASETLKLQRSIQQLAAARDVTRLEWEVAKGDLDTVAARIASGSATLKDQQNAQIEVNDKYAAYLDASFDFDRARLQLMSATGDLRDWAGVAK